MIHDNMDLEHGDLKRRQLAVTFTEHAATVTILLVFVKGHCCESGGAGPGLTASAGAFDRFRYI